MLNQIKQFYKLYTLPIWVVLVLIVVFLIYWFSGSIGNWYEARQQRKFDEKIAELQQNITELTKQRDEAIRKSLEAEAREQSKIIEVDLLRNEISKHNIPIQEAQNKIAEATQKYESDLEFIEKIKTGEVSNFQLCEKQCEDSLKIGYPCRPNYCEKFKSKE